MNKLPSITKTTFKAGFGAYMGFQCAKFCDEIATQILRPAADRLIKKLHAKNEELIAKKNS